MAHKSLIDYAYEVLTSSKEALSFKDLFDKAVEASGIELDSASLKSKMSSFYTQISVDGRFAPLDGKWDLTSRHEYDLTHPKIEEIDDESEDEEDEDKEEKELLKEEIGEIDDSDEESEESDDIDFDKPKSQSSDDEEDF